ncbi:prolipoprotein diacylglyceryl transferase [Synechococcus sp. PCC 7502]|uniref:prolipoprotein diacylglyceryl transferase n=1 Tax=Synechococcus sp. PCC 7502 TaxID=1173263 RepID=UPI00029F9BD0|nr:prolipoprotein diacylglyceryl transferase [Synechococcus sp. PCC 7502]AFY74523.1 prolipoprotein diacylglyceryl transferase [Synechococcus sp. PCC 7502]
MLVFTSPGAVAVQLGSFSVRWYGLLIAIAVIIGTVLAQRLASRRGVNPDLIGDLVIWLVVGAIPMARAYYVAFTWDRFQDQPWVPIIGGASVPRMFAIWEGGIAIHGAIIGGVIAATIFAKLNKLSVWQLADLCMPSLILGQAIGRWGNFFNSEAFGVPTDLPWKLFIPPDKRPSQFYAEPYFHPTFLYESLWNLMVFGILITVFNKFPQAKRGTMVMVYLISYSLGRVWIEGLRTDSLMFGSLRIAQIISLSAIALGVIGLWWLYGRNGRFWDTENMMSSGKS